MFNLFKRNKEKRFSPADWTIGDMPGFKVIHNPDSVQYVNEDAGKVIYFSVLTVSGKNLFTNDAIPEGPAITATDGGWQLKGARKSPGQILVCVISLMNQDDIEWAKDFFNSIRYKHAT